MFVIKSMEEKGERARSGVLIARFGTMPSFENASEFLGKSPSEVSTVLYDRIVPWSRIQSAGVFLSRANEELIEKAQNKRWWKAFATQRAIVVAIRSNIELADKGRA